MWIKLIFKKNDDLKNIPFFFLGSVLPETCVSSQINKHIMWCHLGHEMFPFLLHTFPTICCFSPSFHLLKYFRPLETFWTCFQWNSDFFFTLLTGAWQRNAFLPQKLLDVTSPLNRLYFLLIHTFVVFRKLQGLLLLPSSPVCLRARLFTAY